MLNLHRCFGMVGGGTALWGSWHFSPRLLFDGDAHLQSLRHLIDYTEKPVNETNRLLACDIYTVPKLEIGIK